MSPLLVIATLLAAGSSVAPAASPRRPLGPPQVSPGRGDPFRELSLEDAFAAARGEGKPVLVVLLGSDCGPCDAFDRFVFADETVAAWLGEALVAVRRVDDEAAAARLEVPRVPALVLATAEGEELDRIDRFLEPQEFLAEAQAILQGGGPVGLARSAVEQAPEDPQARLALADALLRRGRRRAALEPLLWVFDHSSADPSWQENRLVVVLNNLTMLQRDLPEAEAALRERRDRASAVVLGPHGDGVDPAELMVSAVDLVALNQALNASRETLEAWDALRARGDASPAVLSALLDRTTQILLLAAKRYDDLLEGLGDPLVALQADLARLQQVKAQAGPRKVDRAYVVSQRRIVVDTAGRYYHALLAAGRESDAATLVELLLGLEPDVESYLALVEAAVVVERDDLARALAERGLAALPQGPARQRLKRFAQRVLREDG